LFRIYAYFFHALFICAALVMAAISLASGPHTLNFYLLPWEGKALIYGLVALALIGAAILLLATRGRSWLLFAGWSILVFVLVVRYFFFSPFTFTPGTGDYLPALGIILAALLATVGASLKPTAQ